jgi:S1-C subfamily serine protease
MENLETVYKKIKPSIVAIASKVSSSPDFPDIIGTGFIAREDGIVITNNHVIEGIKKIPRLKTAPKDEWPATVLYFNMTPRGMMVVGLEIDGFALLKRDEPIPEGVNFYGADVPDLGVIKLKIRSGLPPLTIAPQLGIEEGHNVVIAGFPQGSKPLMALGWVHQLSPTLQKGILGAMAPFSCDDPHAILIDVVAQPGSSGSPIINPDNGNVIGVLYSGYPGTAITYGVPAKVLFDIFKKINASDDLTKNNAGFPTFDEYIKSKVIKTMKPRSTDPNPIIVTKEDLIL